MGYILVSLLLIYVFHFLFLLPLLLINRILLSWTNRCVFKREKKGHKAYILYSLHGLISVIHIPSPSPPFPALD